MEKSRLEALSQRYLEETLEARRYIHRHPEWTDLVLTAENK